MTGSIPEAAAALRSEAVTSVDLTEAALAAIEALNPELGAFVLVDRDGALEAAERADQALLSGSEVGPLTGVPVAVKDIIDMSGHPTRCGSDLYANEPVRHDATLVSRLKQAGAVIVGKTTAHELACGVYSAPASNPWSVDRVPGGSSGGSGAAVASGIVSMGIGSDTGGSIRIPASLCGVVGLKPTYGRVSRAGVEPLAWSLDHLGPLAATVEGCAATLEVIAGNDPEDPTTAAQPPMDLRTELEAGVDGLRLGVLEGPPIEPMQPAVEERFDTAVDRLADSGAELVEVRIPELAHTLAAEFGIVGPEAGAYHREGVRQRPHLIDPAIRSLLVAGLLLPAHQYLRALQARRVITDAIRKAFSEHRIDVLVSPTLPATAVKKEQDEIEYGSFAEPATLSYVRTTAPFNLSGMPSISVPAGHDDQGLPVGLQIAGRPYDEATVVRVARTCEAMNPDRDRMPPLHSERSAA